MIRWFYENRIISDDGSGRDRAGIVPEPKGKRKTLRQKDQIPDETLESESTDEAIPAWRGESFRLKTERIEEKSFVRSFFVP